MALIKLALGVCLLLSLTKLIKSKETASLNYELNLHTYLFSKDTPHRYNPNLRPVIDATKPINVEARVGIKRIFEVNEMEHRVNLFAILIKKWNDQFLKWNPSDFGNITYTYVEYAKVWSPQLALTSEYSDELSTANDRSVHRIYEKYPVKLFSNGNIEFIPAMHMESECLFNYQNFPFEYQMCDFKFQMPYNTDQVNLRMAFFYTQELHKYTPIWSINNINSIETKEDSTEPGNLFRITFKRTMKGHIFTMPSYIVYILTLLMFLLPQHSSQRLIIGSTCLVISTILSYMLSNALPRDDISAWPIVGKLYLFNTILLTFSLLFSMFIINIASCEHATRGVPDWLKRFTINILSRVFCVQPVAFSVFNAYTFKIHDQENAQQINNMIDMSPIEANTNVRVRFYRNSGSDDDAGIEGTTGGVSSATEPSASFRGAETAERIHDDKYEFTRLCKSIHEQLAQLNDRMQVETFKACTRNEWLLVAILMDKVFFLVYCFIVVLVTSLVFRN